MMNKVVTGLALLSAIGAVSVLPESLEIFRRTPDPPAALPQNASEADMKFQPVLDYDKDSCYNVPAIDAQGNVCKGLDNTYTTNTDGCRDAKDLDNQNVYSRSRCNHGWCAYMYEHYFEKDVGLEHVAGVASGHRHEWENVVVWVKDGDDKPCYVAASAHDGYDTKEAKDVRFQDSHPKIVYHKDGAGTHALRFATEDDDNVENVKQAWIQGDIIGWTGYPISDLRRKMFQAFADGGSRPKIDDAVFAEYLKKSIGDRIPEFDCEHDG